MKPVLTLVLSLIGAPALFTCGTADAHPDRIVGVRSQQWLSSQRSSGDRLGDLDGDGIDETVLGEPGSYAAGHRAGAVWIHFWNPDGTGKQFVRITQGESGFSGTLLPDSRFGASVAVLGDVDGDGVPDLAVGTPGVEGDAQTSTGSFWILFLKSNGTVRDFQRIDGVFAGFTESLEPDDHLGASLAAVGDRNDDGVPDVVVGAPGANEARGSVWLMHLLRDGTVRSYARIDTTAGFPDSIMSGDQVGASLALLPDLDGDGGRELAVGAPGADRGGEEDTGTLWVLFLDASGATRGHREIGPDSGGLPISLRPGSAVGASIACLGDLNCDGRAELAVGAPGYDYVTGTVVLLSLGPGATIDAAQILTDWTRGGFVRDTPGLLKFGGDAIVNIGDLDGDGYDEILLSARKTTILFTSNCYISPVSIDFGRVRLTETLRRSYSVTNTGCATAQLTISLECDQMVVVEGGGDVAVEPGATHRVIVEYRPTTSIEVSCVADNSHACGNVALSGTTSNVWVVSPDGTGDYETITSAVANSSPDDDILIAPGVYSGPGNRDIAVGSPNLTIRALEGAGSVTLDCEGTDGFRWSTATGRLAGVNITNARRGIASVSAGLRVDSCSVNKCDVALDCWGRLEFSHGEIVSNKQIGVTSGISNVSIVDSRIAGNGKRFEGLRQDVVTLVGNRITDNREGVVTVDLRGALTAEGNICERNTNSESGGVFYVDGLTSIVISGNQFIENTSEGHGGVLYLSGSVTAHISDNLFLSNSCTFDGGAIWLSSDAEIEANTFVSNRGRNGSALWVGVARADIQRNILAFHDGPATLACVLSSGTISCNNAYGNESGDDLCEANGNFSADPMFCGETDFTLDSESPCAPAGSPCGERVGAMDVGCYPLQFTDVSASASSFAVELGWSAEVSGDVAGFVVYRKDGDEEEHIVNMRGLLDPESRSFRDDSVQQDKRYQYTLQAEFPSGSTVRSKSVTVMVPRADVTLGQNYPNPFNPETLIEYTLPDREFVSLDVYDVVGRRVATLVSAVVAPGEHAAKWDGRLAGGGRAATGVYFYRLETRNKTLTRKMVLLK